MEQEKIKYSDIMSLGFTEEPQNDDVYFDKHGFRWCIITKKLTKRVYLNWNKENQLCSMIRINKYHDIKARLPIRNLAHLKEIVDFFSDKPK